MNYQDITNKFGFIRSRTDLLSSEQNYSSRRRHDYNPPEPYVPLDQRFYKYAGIEHPTITLDPQAYRRQNDYRYFHKANIRNKQDKSISSEQSSSELRSSQYSSDNNCYAHRQLPKTRNYYKDYENEDSSSFELSPYQDDEQSQSDDSFSRQHNYRNSRRQIRQKELMKSTLKGIKQVMQQSQDLDNSEQSQIRNLKKSNEHHRKSIDKIQKATKIMKQKLRTQKLEQQKQMQHQNDQKQNQNSQFIQSARFNENLQHYNKQKIKTFQQSEENSPLKIEKKQIKQQFYDNKKRNDKEQSFQKKQSKQQRRRKRSQQIDQQQQKLVSKYEGKEFHHSISNPVLRKPQYSKSQQKNKYQQHQRHQQSQQNKHKKHRHQIESRDQSVQVEQQIFKQNNPENNQKKHKSLKQAQSYEKKPPVAFAIDNYRDDLTLAEAFKIHCSELRHKLKQQRQQFKGHHEHEKKARKQKKRNQSKTRTFVKNKLKKSTQYIDDALQTRFSSPFTGKNNPLQQFKRMDIIRRRQLAKKYDKVNRLRLLN